MNRNTFFVIVQGHNLEAAAQFSAVLAVKTGDISYAAFKRRIIQLQLFSNTLFYFSTVV